MHPKNIRILDYDYDLPEERIAPMPTENRSGSKLLVYRLGTIGHHAFEHISQLLPKNCSLWLNETRVVNARLWFRKPTGKVIEIFCLNPASGVGDIQQGLGQKRRVEWECYVKGAKKWPEDLTLESSFSREGEYVSISAKRMNRKEDTFTIFFSWDSDHTFGEVLETMGGIPLPPYIKREESDLDADRYQTVFANNQGSVAAPTAGLHFSEEVLQKIRENGHPVEFLTLHVGAGTFKPVSSDTIEGHDMHAEEFVLSQSLIRRLLEEKASRIAVGTTTCRTLESIYWFGVQVLNETIDPEHPMIHQWMPYEDHGNLPETNESLEALLQWMVDQNHQERVMHTAVICAPGYTFRMIQGLITNFHLPKSTLMLLVAAFIGDDWKSVYQEALENDYRFLSYGDSSLLLP